jgi:multicomponent K+:H+ antiporter subunit E
VKRWFPAPLLSAALAAMWLALVQSVAPSQIVTALALGCALPALPARLRPLRARVRRPDLIARLAVHVFIDNLRSCWSVSRIILGKSDRRAHSGFVSIPLRLREPHGLAVLSAIINATPGTVWVELAPDGGALMIHVLDVRDEEALIDLVKTRYETPLMAIFE